MAFSPKNLKIWVDSREIHAIIQTATSPPFTKGTWFLPGPLALFEAAGFGNEVTLPGQAPTTKTHWCRSFKLKVRQGGGGDCEGIHPLRRLQPLDLRCKD